MAFDTSLALLLFFLGSWLAMLLSDGHWAQDHVWLMPLIWAGSGVSSLLVAISGWKKEKSESDPTHGTLPQRAHGKGSHNVAAIDGGTVHYTINEGPRAGWGAAGMPGIVPPTPPDAPEVRLMWINDALYKGFMIDNRHRSRDAAAVSFEPIQTPHCRVTPDVVHDLRAQSKMPIGVHIETEDGFLLTDDNLYRELLRDACGNSSENVTLKTVLCWKDAWGEEFERPVTITIEPVRIHLGLPLPEMVNHPIKRRQPLV